MKLLINAVLIVLIGLPFAGCASRSMLVVARCNSTEAPTSTRGVGLVNQPRPRPEDERLKLVLLQALKNNDGEHSLSSTNIDYVLAYWMDESWDEAVVPVVQRRPMEHVRVYPADPGVPGSGRVVHEFSSTANSVETTTRYLATKGVRLVLYWDDPSYLLEEAGEISGPWTAMPDATNPQSLGYTGAQQFFRLKR